MAINSNQYKGRIQIKLKQAKFKNNKKIKIVKEKNQA